MRHRARTAETTLLDRKRTIAIACADRDASCRGSAVSPREVRCGLFPVGLRRAARGPGPGESDLGLKALSLPQGFALLPTQREEDGPEPEPGAAPAFSGLPDLPADLASWAAKASHRAPIAYLQIVCWGGNCVRGAVVWEGGEVVLGPFPFEEDETAEAARSRCGNSSSVTERRSWRSLGRGYRS